MEIAVPLLRKRNHYLAVAALSLFMGLGGYQGTGVNSQMLSAAAQEAPAFDWSRVSFAQFPPLFDSGSTPQFPPDVVQALGYDPSRAWNAGDSIADVIKLGDVQDAFGLEQFRLDQIAGIAGFDLNQLNLGNVGFLPQQSIADVVSAARLGNLTPSQVAPLGDLLGGTGFGSLGNQTFGNLLSDPQTAGVLQSLQLGQLDLSQYGFSSIPGLGGTQLSQFSGWQGFAISQVPGLANVPLGQFPNPVASSFTMPWALVDVTYGPAEANRLNIVTGSHQGGPFTPIPCAQPSCAYLELTDFGGSVPSLLGSVHGKQWISGKSQKVPGGEGAKCFGILGAEEPTGRHPLGRAFKLVLEEVTESEGKGDLAIYFRISCGQFGKTPYVIGPVPVGSVYEKRGILLGF